MHSEPSDNSSARAMSHRTLAIGAAALGLLVLVAYAPALGGGFVWDDPLLVERNPLVTGEFTLGSIWFKMDFPLASIASWLQWLVWGNNAPGYHIVNVLLHVTNCILLWRVLERLKIPGAWFGAALFAIHPVGAASVAWISEIKNTLSLGFALLSAVWFLQSAGPRQIESRPARGRYFLSLVAFVLALLSKTSVVTLPVVMLGCVWWQRRQLTRRDWLAMTPFFALALGFGLLTIWFQKHQVVLNVTVQNENLLGRLAGAGRAVWFYLGKLLWPLNLCAVYPRWEIDATKLVNYFPLAGLGCAGAVLIWFRKSWGLPVLLALGCFGAALFPVLGLFDMYFLVFSRVSDHFAYWPMIAITTTVAATLWTHLPKTAARVVATILILGLGVLTLQRSHIYANDERLWRDTLAKNPTAWNAQNNLACILAERGEIDEAMRLFAASVKLHPRNASAQCNLGKGALLRNDLTNAETHFRSALEVKPDHPETLKVYGSLLANLGRRDEAVRLLSEAVRVQPDNETRLRLVPLLSAAGRASEAISQCRLVLTNEPGSFPALNNLGWILATSGEATVRNGAEAVQVAERACALTGQKEAMTFGTLAAAYAEAGQFTNAVAAASRAIELAQASGNLDFARANQQLLRLYRANRPYHEPAVKTGGATR